MGETLKYQFGIAKMLYLSSGIFLIWFTIFFGIFWKYKQWIVSLKTSKNRIMNDGLKCTVMPGWVKVNLWRHLELFPLINRTPLRRRMRWSELEEIICARDNVESDDKRSLVLPRLHLNSSPCQLWNCGSPRYIIMLHSFVFIIASKGTGHAATIFCCKEA